MATSRPRFEKFRIYLVFKSLTHYTPFHYLYVLELCDDGCGGDDVKPMPKPSYGFYCCPGDTFISVSLGSKVYFVHGVYHEDLTTKKVAREKSTLLYSYDAADTSLSFVNLKKCKSSKSPNRCPLAVAVARKILVLPNVLLAGQERATYPFYPRVKLYSPESDSWETLPDPYFISSQGRVPIDNIVVVDAKVYISTSEGVFYLDVMVYPYRWCFWRSESLPFSGSYTKGSWLEEHKSREQLVWAKDCSPPAMNEGVFIKYRHLEKEEHIKCEKTRVTVNLGKNKFCSIITGLDFEPSSASEDGTSSLCTLFVKVQVFKIRPLFVKVQVFKIRPAIKVRPYDCGKHNKRKLKWRPELLYTSKYYMDIYCLNPLKVVSHCIMKESSRAAAGRA